MAYPSGLRGSFALFLGSLLIAPSFSFAAAWTQPEGSWQIDTSLLVYNTSRFFDVNGNLRHQKPLTKTELNPYVEYGLTNDVTLGANGFLQYFFTSDRFTLAATASVMTHFYGMELELFARKKLWEQNGLVLSIQPLIKLPSFYLERNGSQTEKSFFDAQLGLLGGYGFSALGFDQFVNLEPSYRLRTGGPADQVRIDATYGVKFNGDWMVMTQLFNTFSVNPPANRRSSFTHLGEDDYDLMKLQLSVVYKLTQSTSVQIGGFRHVHAQNTGGGGGGLVSLWLNF